jgi:hypothetical protein
VFVLTIDHSCNLFFRIVIKNFNLKKDFVYVEYPQVVVSSPPAEFGAMGREIESRWGIGWQFKTYVL